MTSSVNQRADSFNAKKTLNVQGKDYTYYSLNEAAKSLGDIQSLPFSLKVLLENLLRQEDGRAVTREDIQAIAAWLKDRKSDREIAFSPARVLMQDFTGVPAVVDLATMRDALVDLGGSAEKINPLVPVDLVIDHSVMVDEYGSSQAFKDNVRLEFERNAERYAFLKWGQYSLKNFRVVPPGTGICHQVNLEYLAQGVWTREEDGETFAYPDTLVGTDSHTTMVNGLGVLGWGVGGIEAEAAMLGQSLSMLIPEVVGFKLEGHLPEGATATDLVLTVTNMLRAKGVVGKFVEFYGSGLDHLSLADRATIANMAPEYGATCGIFPIDEETVRYLKFTGRNAEMVALVEAYAKAQGMWRDAKATEPVFSSILTLDLGSIQPTIAGPKRPQDKVLLKDAAVSCRSSLGDTPPKSASCILEGQQLDISDGDVVIAAITSCTNTSNPSVMIGAGLLARKALAAGLSVKPWVKTSLAPGSQVVTDYLQASGLDKDLEALGFYLVGYGCTSCIGNSGPLREPIAKAIDQGDLTVSGVLSGNRNFEGRIHPQVKLNYLASPPLVVAYALAGSMKIDITREPIGMNSAGNAIYLKDIWPSNKEIQTCLDQTLTSEMFSRRYSNVFKGDIEWQNTSASPSLTYGWSDNSTYVKKAPYFDTLNATPTSLRDIHGARCLAILGDSITTDHISPAGSIKKDGPAGRYLEAHGVSPADFNSYGARRGNHEIMMRGTFANIRLQNEMTPEVSGGMTKYLPTGEVMSIYDASMKYQADNTPLIVIAGKEYGTGSSRDWAAKGTMLLGVKAVVAESFERIHRSNLVGMGILPLLFPAGVTRKDLNLQGNETIDLIGFAAELSPRMTVNCVLTRADGSQQRVPLLCRIDTADEVEYFKNGGILPYVLRQLS